MIPRWHVGVQLWIALEHIWSYRPTLDVNKSRVESRHYFVSTCLNLSGITIPKFIGPLEPEALTEQVPELVTAIGMLTEDEPFPDPRPGKKVDRVRMSDPL